MLLFALVLCLSGLQHSWGFNSAYKHVGCFKDTANRALPDYLGTFDKSIAVQKCAELAKEKGFTTFSLQYGGQCYSGLTASQTYNKYGPATNCENGLGGSWANDVYLIKPAYDHVGCFKDTRNRALPVYLGKFDKRIAVKTCAELAEGKGFTTFSIQNGGECYTGATASQTYNKYGPATNCKNGLGGSWANDVYSIRPAAYNHVGCFKDTANRALPVHLGNFDKSTAVLRCAHLAKWRGFTTFSIQYGGQCYSGLTASQTYNKYGPATNCENGLGGSWANDVYSIRPPAFKHIGCFKDTGNRALPDQLGTFDKSIAVMKCAELAKGKGFTTFSVQYGGQCFTGATASQTYNKYGPATNCGHGLGGSWANDVYSFPSE